MFAISRRQFLRVGALGAAGAVVVACQPQTVVIKEEVTKEVEKVVEKEVTKEVQKEVIVEVEKVSANQAPEYQEMVKGGQLPPLEERVSLEPMVITPYEEIGTYGGVWRNGYLGMADTFQFSKKVHYEGILRWASDNITTVIPCVAQRWVVSSDAKILTAYLRKGMKHSDGEPFSADDIMFWYEDIILNSELTPKINARYVNAGEPVTVRKLDDLTVEFSFPVSNPLFEQRLATHHGSLPTTPKHYMQQFHPSYVDPAELTAKAKQAGYDSWATFFQSMDLGMSNWANPDRPVLDAWSLSVPVGVGPQVSFTRQPYYWKVDTARNQLPYLDEVIFKLHADVQGIVMDAVAGELDFQHRHIDVAEYYPLLHEYAEEADYEIFFLLPDKMNEAAAWPNLTHQDPVKREILQNKDFRIALSYAIDKDALNTTVWRGMAPPRGAAPWPESGFEHKRLETLYQEYDPDKANALLDKHYPNKDSDGYRLGPDGQRISFIVEITASHVDVIDMFEMIKVYWADVGVEITLRPLDRALYTEHRNAGEFDIIGHKYVEKGLFPLLGYSPWVPTGNGNQWYVWYRSKGEKGQEPPEAIRRQYERADAMVTETSIDRVRATFMEILDTAADEFLIIPVVGMSQPFGVKKKAFRNIPMEGYATTSWPDPAPQNPPQFFWKEG